MFYVYVIWNKQREKIYVGYTGNLKSRLDRHNKLLPTRSKSFTCKNSGNWKLIYSENFKIRKEAMIRERQLKSCQGRKFIRDIIVSKFKI
ncbi:MAG: Excinuclease ABC C subunit domain protein [Parcubacteria group bacterium GW2011_GWF2_39_13b]|nr:MAG: Excinuclease ABC C subunit domain protein [Parcubacteria group bacterium GW2011_GWF2_39_13b]